MATEFTVDKQRYTIALTWWKAINVLPEQFSISITKILSDNEQATETLNTLVLDDEKTLKLMWHFMEPTASMGIEQFLTIVTTPEIEAFREAFWAEVVNFSGSLKKNILLQMWDQFKRDLKTTDVQQRMNSVESPSQ